MSMLRLCLGIKTFQSTVTVICQVYFLMSTNTLNDPRTSPQAKALFGMNICVSMMNVIMGFITLFLKNHLMKGVVRESTIMNKSGDDGHGAEVELGETRKSTGNPLHNNNTECDDIAKPDNSENGNDPLEVWRTQVRQKGFENENNDVSGIVGEQENRIAGPRGDVRDQEECRR